MQLYKYQEQSQLLDAYLEEIVVSLSTLLRQHATAGDGGGDASPSGPAMQRIQGTCRLLSVLVVVRGYKTVVKFFPHEAQDLVRIEEHSCDDAPSPLDMDRDRARHNILPRS